MHGVARRALLVSTLVSSACSDGGDLRWDEHGVGGVPWGASVESARDRLDDLPGAPETVTPDCPMVVLVWRERVQLYFVDGAGLSGYWILDASPSGFGFGAGDTVGEVRSRVPDLTVDHPNPGIDEEHELELAIGDALVVAGTTGPTDDAVLEAPIHVLPDEGGRRTCVHE